MCEKMSENCTTNNKKMSEKKCSFKCSTCENYSKVLDFCVEKEIEEVSKQVKTDFSQCDSYLISSKLVMF